jgi:hypothetical protein
MQWSLQKVNNIGQLVLLVGSVIGGYIAIDNHYAKAQQVKVIELRLEQKILIDKQTDVHNRMIKVITKMKENPTNEELVYVLQRLENDDKDIDKSLEINKENMEKIL